MSARVTPLLRLAVLCQRVEFDEIGRPFGLVEPLHTISVPLDGFNKPLGEIFLYTQVEDAVGSFDISVRVEDENRDHVRQPHLASVSHTFAGGAVDRIIPHELILDLNGVVLPQPGLYYFIVRCDTTSLHQRDGAARAPVLRVLPI